MRTFDTLFGSPWGYSNEPVGQQAMSEQALYARELAMLPLMVNAPQQRNYEALRNAFRVQEAWDDATVNQRYHNFCARLREAKKRAGME